MVKKIKISVITAAVIYSSTLQVNAQENNKKQFASQNPINIIKGRVTGQSGMKTAALSNQSISETISNVNGQVNFDNHIKVSLFSVVLETIAQSYKTKAALEKVRQSKIDLDNAYSGYLPSINATYKTAKTKARPGEDDEPNKYFEDTSYNLTLRQNIYSGGATQTE
ncbi:MAG: TolC family protein, partial [Campylobacterota bacterium]|nr:TolC family protein [Campylobacterota bacterium]